MKTIYILVISLLFFNKLYSQTHEETFYTDKDCKTSSSQINDNFNGDPLTVVYNSAEGLYEVSLIFIDISSLPDNAVINSAYLYIYCSLESGNVALRIGRLADDYWSENGVTYNNMPYAETPPSFKYYSTNQGVWNGHNVTEFVQGWYNETYANNGFQLFTESDGSLAVFYDREVGSSWRPYLVVNYTCEPAAPTGVTASDDTYCDRVVVSWNSVSGASSYDLYRGSSLISDNTTFTTINDYGGSTSSTLYKVYANNACGTSSSYGNDYGYKKSAPSQPGTISGTSTPCVSTSNPYSISSVSSATSYTWSYSGGGTPSGTGTSCSLTPTSSGTLSVTANNSCGSSSARTKSLSVSSTPSQPGSITGSTTPCVGSSLTYSVSTVSGAASYGWTLPTGWSGSSTSNSITVTVGSNSGSVGVRAENSCGNSSYSYLSVNPVTVPSQPGSISGITAPCVGSSQTYSIAPVSGATSYTWWLPSNWSGSSTTNSIIATVGSGDTSIFVTANNGSCISPEQSLAISPLDKPAQPGPISGEDTICEGSNQTYSIVAISGATSYTWSYSGGGSLSGTGTSCNLTPTSSGTLSVTANNSCGSSIVRTIVLVVISKPSQPGTISGEIYPCVGSLQTYNILSVSGATSYTWTVPVDWSGSDTTNSISVVVGSTGGNICVTANNECGSSPSKCILVGSVDSVSQPGTISGETNPCTNSEQIYSIESVEGATSYEWTLPNGWSGTSNSNSITVSVGVNNGDICVKAINSCNTSEYRCLPVTIGGIAPEQPGLISGEGSPCVGSSVTYKIAPVDSAGSYTWSLPTGWTGISAVDSIVVIAGNNSGNICVTANNECGNSLQRCFTVNPISIPAQPGSITGESTPCTGTQQSYNIPAVQGAESYSWELPENWAGSSSTTSINATIADNSGEICVVAKNKCGTSPEKCLLITTAKVPDQPSEIIGDVNPCWDSIITYTVTIDANAESYEWELPEDWAGTSTTNLINTTMGHDTGNVCVMAVNQCGSSVERCLIVQPKFCPCIPPEAPSGVSATDGMVMDEITITWEPVSGASKYIIYRNEDSIVTRLANQNYYTDYSAPCEVVTYYVYSSNGKCKSDNAGSDTGYRLNCGSTTLVNDISAELYNLYPNPATHQLIIELKDISTVPTKIEIYNVLHQEMLNVPVNEEKTQLINVSSLKPGLYFIKLSWKEQYVTKKFIIEE